MKFQAQHNENVAVQKFYLGLDFDNAVIGCRIAEGNYIAAQISDETDIDWKLWVYKPELGAIVRKVDNYKMLTYKYVIFRVSRYEE